jgi:hypothetical protein
MSAIDPQSNQSFHPTKPGFWRRQFVLPATTPQIILDVVFGMVGPVLCFAFDPVVFRDGFMGRPLFQEFQLFAYSFSALEIAALSAWLLFGARLSRGRGFIGGVLVGGALFCLATGLVLLPFSVLGLMFGIGIFGFTPFVTAIVYLRNGCRATERHHDAAALSQAGALVLGFILSLGAPALLRVTIHEIAAQSVDNIIHGDSQQVSAANHRLRALRFVVGAELDRIVDSYATETDPSRKQLLGSSYHEITGEDIEARIRSFD